MRLLLLGLFLFACNPPCPEGLPIHDDDIPCGCYGETVDALPGCVTDCLCTEDGFECEECEDYEDTAL